MCLHLSLAGWVRLHLVQGECDADISYECILPACARISHALGDQFEPFLPLVMEPVLAGARQVGRWMREAAWGGV